MNIEFKKGYYSRPPLQLGLIIDYHYRNNGTIKSGIRAEIGVFFGKLVFKFNTKNKQDWPESTRILTDQFSPANLLNVK